MSWFNAREAVDVGVALADQFVPDSSPAKEPGPRRRARAHRDPDRALRELLRRAERDARTRDLNFYQRARFANSFKWRLLEGGVEGKLADEVTRRLVVHLAGRGEAHDAAGVPPGTDPVIEASKAAFLFKQANQCASEGAYDDAAGLYEAVLRVNARHVEAMNNLGAALCHLGRYAPAEDQFRAALALRPDYADAHGNLGALLRSKGLFEEAEIALRYALTLKPDFADARCNLGSALAMLGRIAEARAQFRKVLKHAPEHAAALLGLAQLARSEGSFEEAQALLKRALRADPDQAGAWAALARVRKMTAEDADWARHAEALLGGVLTPLQQADLRYALGKYFDDVGEYKRAFEQYQRANALQKAAAEPFDHAARSRFVDALVRGHSRAALAVAAASASASVRPVIVAGMPRSGTSLVEQIIASHPAAFGAGELGFWNDAVRAHGTAVTSALPDEALRAKLAEDYLAVLQRHSTGAERVVDKAPVNADYLGLIHSVFPAARIIYVQRQPIDTCLSCFFQQFSPTQNHTMDLADLAHYYREHHRLMNHWRAVLPPGSMLEVPYAELVADPEGWTRRILGFLGLEWHVQCLNFHDTQRLVLTASDWQVRQRIYRSSVDRWRRYAKLIGPLRGLADLDT